MRNTTYYKNAIHELTDGWGMDEKVNNELKKAGDDWHKVYGLYQRLLANIHGK